MNLEDYEQKRAEEARHLELVSLLTEILDYLKLCDKNDHEIKACFAVALQMMEGKK